jgi:hypothetical protein
MAERYADYPDRNDRDRDRYDRDRYARDDRNGVERAGDEVRSWFGEGDAARARRMDERDRTGGGSPWPGERSYGSNREYGDRDYGWREGRENQARGERDGGWRSGRDSGWRGEGDFGSEWRNRSSSRDYSGISYGLSGGHRDDARVSPGDGGLEAGYLGYRREYNVSPQYRQVNDRTEPIRGEWRHEHTSEWWRVPGPHAGRGPRSYQRSDERIREELNDRLTAHGMIDASDIECQVQNGEVTLTGFVGTRAEKRAAEDVAEDLHGVREVHNQLRLRSNAEGEGVGRTSVLGLTESHVQTSSATNTAESGRSRSRS